MIRLSGGSAVIAGLCLLISGCDGGVSAVPVQKAGEATQAAAASSGTPASDRSPSSDADRATVPRVDGRPMWSATRRYTAEQNALRAFERNGAAFGADSVDAFVKKAHAFTSRPPKGSLFLSRDNGDRLIYDPAGNVFAIASADGAPRTMFKPDTGMAYWEQVKVDEADRAARRGRRGDGP
jgi:pyocin large subunit-like protein